MEPNEPDAPAFSLSSCTFEGASRPRPLTRHELVRSLRTGSDVATTSEDPLADRGVNVGGRVASFENAETFATRLAAFGSRADPVEAADAAAEWLPIGIELRVLVEGGARELELRIGGHRIVGERIPPPTPPYAESDAGFALVLQPIEAAALTIAASTKLVIDGEEATLPRRVVDEARHDLPESIDVPLTLVEF